MAPHPARCARHPLPAARGEGIGTPRARQVFIPRPRVSGGVVSLAPARAGERGRGEGVTAHAGAGRKVGAGVLAPHPARCARHPLPALRGEGIGTPRARQASIPRPRESGGVVSLAPAVAGERGRGEGVPSLLISCHYPARGSRAGAVASEVGADILAAPAELAIIVVAT